MHVSCVIPKLSSHQTLCIHIWICHHVVYPKEIMNHPFQIQIGLSMVFPMFTMFPEKTTT